MNPACLHVNGTSLDQNPRVNGAYVKPSRPCMYVSTCVGGETLEVVQVGEVVKRDGEFQFEIWPPFTEDTLWPGKCMA